VTDVLVRRGNSYVKRSVAANRAASISDATYGRLVESARQDGTLAERIVRRPDVPPHRFHALLSEATETVRARLVAAAPPERHADIREVLAKVAGGIARSVAPPRDYAEALQKLRAQYPDGKLGDDDVTQLAASRDFTSLVAAFSLTASVPPDLVEQLLTGERVEPVLILCKALRFKWPTARAVIHARPLAKLSVQALTEACDDFNRLSPASARQMLHYWRGSAGR
jgi:hypothetical protein